MPESLVANPTPGYTANDMRTIEHGIAVRVDEFRGLPDTRAAVALGSDVVFSRP